MKQIKFLLFLALMMILSTNLKAVGMSPEFLLKRGNSTYLRKVPIKMFTDSATISLYFGGMSFDDFRIKLNSNDDPNFAVDYYFSHGSPLVFKVPAGNYYITLEAMILDPWVRATPNWSTPDGPKYGHTVDIYNLYLDGNQSFIGFSDMYVPE